MQNIITKILKPEILFVAFSLIFGLLLIIITPPLQSPDEDYHFLRTYSLAEGHILPIIHNNAMGDFLPCAFQIFNDKYSILNNSYISGIKTNFAEIQNSAEIKLNNDEKCFFNQKYQALYSPIAYIPQVIGIIFGKFFTNSILYLLYCSQFFMLLFYTIAGYFTIKSIPFLKQLSLLLLLTPMSLSLAASVSADGVLIALSFLYFAKILQYSYSEKNLNKKQFFFLMLLSIMLALVKQSILLSLFVLFIPKSKFNDIFQAKSLNSYFIKIVILLFPAFIATVLWSKIISEIFVPINGSNPELQLNYIIKYPLEFLFSLIITLFYDSFLILCSLIGHLGWYNLPLSSYVPALYYVVLFANLKIATQNAVKFNSTFMQKFILLLVCILYFFLICMIIFLSWIEPSHCGYWSGLQGRYFIPLLLPLFTFIYFVINDKAGVIISNRIVFINFLLLIVTYQNVFHRILSVYYN